MLFQARGSGFVGDDEEARGNREKASDSQATSWNVQYPKIMSNEQQQKSSEIFW